MKLTCNTIKKLKRNRYFTLIELLVILCIISILLALLIPALNKVMVTVNRKACTSNQRQIMVYSYSWSQDNNGWWLPGLWFKTLKEQNYGYVDEDGICPDDPDHNGYGMNTNFVNAIPYMGNWWGGPGHPWHHEHARFKLQQSTKPQITTAYADSRTWYGALWQSSPFWYSLYADGTPHRSDRHDDGAILSFLDGSTKFMTHETIQVNADCSDGKYQFGKGGHYFKFW